ISAIASTQEIMSQWQVGTHGGTYGGNAMGCAAAEATIDVLRDENLVENAYARGEQLRAGLREIAARYPVLGDVRGPGLMVGCEFTDPASGQPDAATTKKIVQHALEDGKLILLTCGTYSNIIRWIPPLVVSADQINAALAIFERAVAASQG